ncbi:MAG: MiaB/RimO family radical SAM methylthiotransferase [Dehalococcoidia bacterium]
MSDRPLASIITLGCKLNLADSEAVARDLVAAGYRVVDRVVEADAYVVNTCSVTHVADQKSRRLIRSVRRIAPAAAVTVTGCFPRSAGDDAIQALGADLVFGTRQADREALVDFLAHREPRVQQGQLPAPASLHTRAFIKAQEGCNDVCAFCIVPRTRGREESRTTDAVVADIDRVTAGGTREVVITGTQLGAWGRDLSPALAPHHLISGVLERVEVPRIRFSSLQPQDITPDLLALWRDPRLMPQFHLALQSGSDRVLSSMRRRYTTAEFFDAAARIRAAVPGAAITTDVIAGFPGETDADFDETLALCRSVGFARLHCFPYSQRLRTAAVRFPEQVPHPQRQGRMARLLALASELQSAFLASHRGETRPVLWESAREIDGETLWFGYTDNYCGVYASGERLANRILPTTLGNPFRDGLRGVVAA